MAERTQAVTVERIVAAPPNAVFDLLTDPTRHSLIDGSGMIVAPRPGNPKRLRLGSKFSMEMKGAGLVPYRVTNTVVEFEANRLIAWRHVGRHRWRWELEAVEGGKTRVRETFDFSTAWSGKALELLGYPERNRAAMERSLDRLADHFEQAPSPE